MKPAIAFLALCFVPGLSAHAEPDLVRSTGHTCVTKVHGQTRITNEEPCPTGTQRVESGAYMYSNEYRAKLAAAEAQARAAYAKQRAKDVAATERTRAQEQREFTQMGAKMQGISRKKGETDEALQKRVEQSAMDRATGRKP